MTGSVAARVVAGGTATLVATLILVGFGTAVVLHSQRERALDDALLAAAHGRAHPAVDAEVEIEHSRSPVDAWLVQRDDSRVPAKVAKAARKGKRPLFTTVGDERLVLLPFEVEHHDDDDDEKLLAAAAGRRVTIGRSVGPFLLVYGVLAGLAAILASLVQLRVVRRAFGPVEQAREEASRVVGFGVDQRLTEDAPTEIQPLLAAINELLDRLQRAHDVQSRFTAEAAHELRTPVATMLGELDVALRTSRTPQEYETLLGSIREEVQRLRMLVEGLTALTRVDIGEVGRGRELMRAGEVAANVAAAEKSTFAASGISIDLVVEEDPEIEVHRSLVEAALANLLRNAARHAPGAAVQVRVGRAGDLAVFDVDDAGPGVPESEREALFGRFVRRGEARERDRTGLGLGLSIAREVARRHGGDCVLEESPQGGLRARLTLQIVSSANNLTEV